MKQFQIVCVASNSCRFFTKNELADLMQGYSAEELMNKVFSDNFITFLSKFYTDAYLEN